MSDELITTKPVLFFNGVNAGNYLFEEYLIRPGDFATLFPQGDPTFPDMQASLDHPAWPPSTVYATLPADTAIPLLTDPAQNWIAPTDLFLWKISTDTWARGDGIWTLETARIKQRRLIYREQLASAADIPDNDGWYGFSYHDPEHYTPLEAVPFASALVGFAPAFPVQDWDMVAQQIVTSRISLPPVYGESAPNYYLSLLDPAPQTDSQFPELGNLNLLAHATPQKTQLRYQGELPVRFTTNPANMGPTRWMTPPSAPLTAILDLEAWVWRSYEPLDGFVVAGSMPTKKRRGGNLPALTALGVLGALLLCSVDGNPPAQRLRKRRGK